jgi:hypothetical protein
MAQDFYKRSSTFKALSLGDGIGILTGIGNPWDEYINVPLGSRYYKQDGTEWKKVGAGDTVGNWQRDYSVIAVPSLYPTQYAYNSATVNNGNTTYVNGASLVANTEIGKTYLARFSGIIKTPTSQGCTVGYFNGATEITNSGFRINHTNTDGSINLVLPIVATANTTTITIKIKSLASGSTCSIRNSLVSLESL